MRGTYPSCTVEHFHIKGIPLKFAVNQGEGMAGGHPIEEWTGEEGGGV